MDADSPFHVDARGRTATAGHAEHVRDLVEQVLFTSPGERVNRPTFGAGLLQLVFLPNAEPLAATLKLSAQAALQQWLGDLIQVQDLTVDSDEATLRVTVAYLLRRDQRPQLVELTRSL
jgi:phage baseplate assembly protein W